MDEPGHGELAPEPFDWDRLLRWFLVGGLAVWIVAGSISWVLLAYFSDSFGGFITGTETGGHLVSGTYKATTTLAAIAFRVWVGAATLYAFGAIREFLADRAESD